MQIIKLDIRDIKSIDEAAKLASKILRDGETVVYPTDTAYGLGGNALDQTVLEKIFRIKQRTKEKPLSVAVKDVAMAKKIAIVSTYIEKFLNRIWPGPVTVILPRRSMLPDILTNGRPVGLRCPKYPLNEAIFQYINFPITATSANISGENTVYSLSDLPFSQEWYGNGVCTPNLLIDAGPLPKTPPSTIIDLTGQEARILRVGPVNPTSLLKIFRETREEKNAAY